MCDIEAFSEGLDRGFEAEVFSRGCVEKVGLNDIGPGDTPVHH